MINKSNIDYELKLNMQINIKKMQSGVETWNAWKKNNKSSSLLASLDFSDPSWRNTAMWNPNSQMLILDGIDLSGAMLVFSNLSKVRFWKANFSNATLIEANLSGADCTGANFSKASLGLANLSQAKLENADLSGADLELANLSRADLSKVKGLMLSNNDVFRTRFSPGASDQWSTLRRIYTGPRMLMNIIFVILFFAPLALKGAVFGSIAGIQNLIIDVVRSRTAGESASNQQEPFSIRILCDAPESGIVISIPPKEVRGDHNSLSGVEQKISCRSLPIWQLLLGYPGKYGIWMPILTAILVAYQITRFLLTSHVSLMRDAEERSGVSPPKNGSLAYPKLYRVHQVLSIIFWIGIAAFLLRAWEFLSLIVIVP